MIEIGLHQLTHVLRAEFLGLDIQVKGVSIDTRTLEKGQLFIALKGEHSDGHAYLSQAQQAGASAAIVEEFVEDCSLPQLKVTNARLALGRLAEWWRVQLKQCKFIALTGSNGKTTVKEMLAAILSHCGETYATKGNFNNDLGMPLTLLSVGREHRFAVLEMGANHAGEIEYMTHIAHPHVALVNNAGPAHLEGFGSLTGVAHAKGEIYSGLTEEGIAILNADDAFVDYWRSICADKKMMAFAMDRPVDVQGDYDAVTQMLSINIQGQTTEVRLSLLGMHNAKNALAAATTAYAAGASLDAIASGLSEVKAVPGRLCLQKAKQGFVVIDDSYNANPASLLAGAEVAASMSEQAWLALGDLGELGEDSIQIHKDLAQELKNKGIKRLFTLGTQSAHTAEVFGEEGVAFESVDELANAVNAMANQDVVLLVKGSRTSRMERVVQALCEAV